MAKNPRVRECRSCGEVKATTDYRPRRASCKDCERAYDLARSVVEARRQSKRASMLLRVYGITMDEYAILLESQGGVCAICLKHPRKYNLVVDHSHKTGKIRGLLCSRCNLAIGKLGDNAMGLLRAYEYLKNAEQQ